MGHGHRTIETRLDHGINEGTNITTLSVAWARKEGEGSRFFVVVVALVFLPPFGELLAKKLGIDLYWWLLNTT